MRVGAAAGQADHVIHLNLAAGADTQVALDAGIHIHGNGRMAAVGGGGRLCREACRVHILRLGIAPKFGIRVVRRIT